MLRLNQRFRRAPPQPFGLWKRPRRLPNGRRVADDVVAIDCAHRRATYPLWPQHQAARCGHPAGRHRAKSKHYLDSFRTWAPAEGSTTRGVRRLIHCVPRETKELVSTAHY